MLLMQVDALKQKTSNLNWSKKSKTYHQFMHIKSKIRKQLWWEIYRTQSIVNINNVKIRIIYEETYQKHSVKIIHWTALLLLLGFNNVSDALHCSHFTRRLNVYLSLINNNTNKSIYMTDGEVRKLQRYSWFCPMKCVVRVQKRLFIFCSSPQ